MGFICVKLIEVELLVGWNKDFELFDFYCVVYIKEVVMLVNYGIFLVQKKKIIYLEWNKCFDIYFYEGCVVIIVVL